MKPTNTAAFLVAAAVAAAVSFAPLAQAEPGAPLRPAPGGAAHAGSSGPHPGDFHGPDRPPRGDRVIPTGPDGPRPGVPNDFHGRWQGAPWGEGSPPWGWGPPPPSGWRGSLPPPGGPPPPPFDYWGFHVTPVWDPGYRQWGFSLFGVWIPL